MNQEQSGGCSKCPVSTNLATEVVRGESELRLIWSAEEIVQRNLDMRNAVFRESYMPFENLLFFADAGNGDQFA